MIKRIFPGLLITICALALAGCAKEAPPPQRPVPEVTATTVKPQTIPYTPSFVAQTESSQQVNIVARVSGFLDKIAYREGEVVKEGQVLFQLDPKPFQAQLESARGELQAQQARYTTAEANLGRVKPLAQQNALSQADLDRAQGDFDTAKAAVFSARAKVTEAELNLGYTTIRSPVNGLASRALQRQGTFINSMSDSANLTYVAAIDPIWVNFSISQNQLAKWTDEKEKGLVVIPKDSAYEVDLVLSDGKHYPYKGQINFADPSFSQDTGSFMVRAVLPNPKRELKPGMFVTALMKGAVRPNAVVVPQLAVQQGSNGHLVYVVKQDGTAEVRPVVVGDYSGDKDIVIMSGLQAGDRVVVEGMLKVVPGQPVRIAEAGAAKEGVAAKPEGATGAKARPAEAGGQKKPAPNMFTHFFIDRPILSSVISILIVLGGAVAMVVSPIEQYPELAPPQVTVEARYPGATAEVIANTVAAPIETQINGVDNLLYYNSVSSSSGNVIINVVFKPGSDPDINQVNVQNRVSQALPLVPQVVSQQGVTVEKQSSSLMMIVSVFSPDDRYDATYIDNYTNLYVLEELKRVRGANRSLVFGLPDIAMRVWLRPDRMAQLGITVQEVTAAIQSQNQTFGIGQMGAEPSPKGTQQTFVVTAQGLLTKPDEFENIIVRAAKEGTAIVRVRDIGRVELAKRDYSITSRVNGRTATTIGIYQQPSANAVATATAVRARLEELKKQFPTGLDYKVTLDTSLFTLNSIDKVVHTFFEAVVLVIAVVFLFLQSLRATIIPILAVPVSIIGTFIGMHLLGFSINMLTMFGMILAIGLVVDDAIVVVENVEVNMTKLGLSALDASKRAMSEIAGALISIVLVLVAVFLPVAFLGGITGTLYQQFAITIAISVVISGVMALTLSPALAAIIIRAHHGEKRGFFRWFENGFNRLTQGYVGVVARMIQGWPIALLAFAGVLAGIVLMFRILPSSFVPDEDQGYFFIVVEAPDTANQGYVGALAEKVEKILASEPAVQDVAVVNGYSMIDGTYRNNAAIFFPSLKPFEERKDPALLAASVLPRLNRQFAALKEGFVVAVNPPAIPGLGTTGGFEFYMQNRGSGDVRATSQAVETFLSAARKRPELSGLTTTFRGATQQLFVDLDRNKAEVLGVPVQDAFQAMQSFFGSSVAGQFSQFSRVWWVVLQADAQFRVNPDDFSRVYVRSSSGSMIPLSALIRVRYVSAPKLMERFNGFPAVKITGEPAQGYSSGQALAAMEAVAREALPGDFSFAWAGQAQMEKESGGTSAIAFIAGLIVVFLLLAAQFEKWTVPVAVVLTVPIAILGALLLTWARGLDNDVYFQVGLVTLVGLSAKNAILICEFALERVHAGMSAREAAIEAAGLRFRAIVMTSLAFGLGCVPLALASGPGANSLRAIGTGVIGGILASTVVAILFAPLFFWMLESMSARFAGGKRAHGGNTSGASKREDD